MMKREVRTLMVLLICVVSAGCSTEDTFSETEQNSINFSPALKQLGPVGYWRLGEASGTTAFDSAPNPVNGTYSGTVGLKTFGSISGDPDYSVLFDETEKTGYVNIPDSRKLSLTQAWDNFNRFGTNGWGTSAGRDAWQVQVSSASYFSTDGDLAKIDPSGNAGTWQIGIPAVSQVDGDMQIRATWSAHASGGTLQPVTLVARRVDNNNFLRASLEELSDARLQLSIYKTVGGTSTPLAQVVLVSRWTGYPIHYAIGDWYYLRFQFDGQHLRAKAWPMDTVHTGSPDPKGYCPNNPCPLSYEPLGWTIDVVNTDTPVAGTVAVRSSNSLGSSRPVVHFDSFWLQTLGFSVHYAVRISSTTMNGDGSPVHENDALGKGASHNTSDHESEYEARYIPSNTTDGCPDCLKFYVFNNTGGLGAGTDYVGVKPGTWYDVVAELDSGDYLDWQAGVTMYVNGALVQGTAPNMCGGNMYSGMSCNASGQPAAGDPEWQIVPVSGTRSLKIGTFDTYEHWFGAVDEVAIFNRKLSSTEVANLYSAWR